MIDFNDKSKDELFQKIEASLRSEGLTIARKEPDRPWGGFFVIDEAQADLFCRIFFPNLEASSLRISGKLSPKMLLVQSGKRLSWQYHHRRAEIWKLVAGTAGIVTSHTDEEGDLTNLKEGQVIQLDQGQRHRLVGLDGWGLIAEIWRHTDAQHPSDEEDIIRLQDDFGRL